MPYYRTRPITIEAIHFLSIDESLDDLVEFAGANAKMYVRGGYVVIMSDVFGESVIQNGDYVLKDCTGNLCRLDPRTFEDTYIIEI